MKNQTSFLVLAILGVFALSACMGETELNISNPTDAVDLSSTGTLVLQPATPVTPQQDALQPVAPPFPAQSEADTAAFNGAQQLKDPTFCDKIKDEEYMKVCKTTLSDELTMSDAVNKMDIALCDKLSTEDMKSACAIQIEVLKKNEQTIAEVEDREEQVTELKNDIQQAGDVKRCAELEDANQIAVCELNLLVNKATTSKDVTICKQASTDATVKACENDAKQYILMDATGT